MSVAADGLLPQALPRCRSRSPRRWLRWGARVAVTGAYAASLGGFLGSWSWVFGLLDPFRAQYALGALGLAVLAALAGGRRSVALALGVAGLNAVPILPAWLPPAAAEARPAEPGLRLLVLNVGLGNRQYARVAELLRREDPDLVGLVEVDASWLRALAPALGGYPVQHEHPLPGAFGIALYARRGIEQVEVAVLGERDLPSLVARGRLGGEPLHLVLTHPYPPVTRRAWASRERQMAAIAEHLRDLPGHRVVAGDLNATPWSPTLRGLRRALDLHDTRRGFGLQATWPAGTPWLRIPIDHVLVSDGLVAVDRRVGPPVGSDHLPVIVDLAPRG